ncbi:MAG: hypothetical protein HY094_04225 [Candidatus Melainabacteria bacterium]|nr:hypothetical protein [Candidatus Melainabacteria bacterium]
MIKQLPIFIKALFLIFLINSAFVLAYNSFSQSSMSGKNQINAEKLFKSNCSGCHLSGQNLIKPDKPLIGSQKLKSKESFSAFISAPPPPMPNFKNIVENPSHLDALYKYVTSLMGK